MEEKTSGFPASFFWGCSTSAHQIEGGLKNDWTEWESSQKRLAKLKEEKKDPRQFVSGKACESYIRQNADIDCLKQLGVNAYRFSLDWSRIEPEEGAFNTEALETYRQFILKLRQQGMEPFVTLWHWPVPLWVRDQGGWTSRKTVASFARFVETVQSHLGKEVTHWITLNEPYVYTSNSYFVGVWPPQKKSLLTSLRVLRNLVRAHKAAYPLLKKRHGARVGIATHNIHFDPRPAHPINRLLAALANWAWNDWFLHQIRKEQDFIGLNYYFRSTVNFAFGKNENKIVSDLGWELYPEGLYKTLLGLKKHGKPVYVTEHGLADKEDRHRTWYLQESLRYAHKALKEGVDLRGYFHWSLLDNFEWAEGFIPRFGLFEVNFDTCERIPRSSVAAYRAIITSNGASLFS